MPEATPVPPPPRVKRDTSRRFTDEQVWEIRRRFNAGERKKDLADEFGVTYPTISNAIHGLFTYANV